MMVKGKDEKEASSKLRYFYSIHGPDRPIRAENQNKSYNYNRNYDVITSSDHHHYLANAFWYDVPALNALTRPVTNNCNLLKKILQEFILQYFSISKQLVLS